MANSARAAFSMAATYFGEKWHRHIVAKIGNVVYVCMLAPTGRQAAAASKTASERNVDSCRESIVGVEFLNLFTGRKDIGAAAGGGVHARRSCHVYAVKLIIYSARRVAYFEE